MFLDKYHIWYEYIILYLNVIWDTFKKINDNKILSVFQIVSIWITFELTYFSILKSNFFFILQLWLLFALIIIWPCLISHSNTIPIF